MKKLIGRKKTNTAVFISGAGTNFKNLLIFEKKTISPIKIKLVISDNAKAKGLLFAKKYKIKKKILNLRKKYDFKLLLNILRINNIKLICLAGFMRILPGYFIKNFEGTILNIHPSLLPKYKGLNVHSRVLRNKEKYSGCTVHHVNRNVDEGKIVLQRKIKILKNDNPVKLKKKIQKQEYKLYPEAILKIFN